MEVFKSVKRIFKRKKISKNTHESRWNKEEKSHVRSEGRKRRENQIMDIGKETVKERKSKTERTEEASFENVQKKEKSSTEEIKKNKN